MKKVIIAIIVVCIIAMPIAFFFIGDNIEKADNLGQNETGQIEEEETIDNGLPKGELTHGDNILYGTDLPLQGNNVSDVIEKETLTKLDEEMISDFNLEEITKHFKGKDIYFDPENNGEHALYMANIGQEKEVEGFDKDRFLVQLQHSTRNLDILAIKVDNRWEFPITNKDSEEFIQFADDKAYIMFDVTRNFIVNYNSVFLEVQQLVLVDKEGNILIVGGDIIVA